MKKRFALLLAVCLLAMALPMNIMADEAPQEKPAAETVANEAAKPAAETAAVQGEKETAADQKTDAAAEEEEKKAPTTYKVAGIELTLPEGFANVEEDETQLIFSADENGNDVIMISSIPVSEAEALYEDRKEGEKISTDKLFDLVEKSLFEMLQEDLEKTFEVKSFTVNEMPGRYASYTMGDSFFSMEIDYCALLNNDQIVTIIREKIEMDLSSLESSEEGEEGDEPLTGEEELEIPAETELPAAPETAPAETENAEAEAEAEAEEEAKPIDMSRAFMSIVFSAKVVK